MRIIGIDPGLRITGFGVIDAHASQLGYVASGIIRTSDGELPERLRLILDGVAEVISTYGPECAAVENVFLNINPHSTLLLGQARGAAICALVSAGLPVAEYTALQTKQATVGHGKASKTQVQEMVQRLLGLSGRPSADAADALACAICHAHARATLAVLARSPTGIAVGPHASLRMRRGRLVG